MNDRPFIIDNLQYSNWSEGMFRDMNRTGLAAVHVTIVYHEDFREMVEQVSAWNRRFERHADLIVQGFTADDVRRAHAEGKTAIIYGYQNPSPIEDDIGLVESATSLAPASCSSVTTTRACWRPAAMRTTTRGSPAWESRSSGK